MTNGNTNQALAQLAEERTVVLSTFRRDGTPVPTPIHVVVRDGKAYFRTWNTTGKVKRMRNNPIVEVAPSTFRGKATGAQVRARARQLDPDDPLVAWARQEIPRKHPVMQPLVPRMHRLMGRRTLYYELTDLD